MTRRLALAASLVVGTGIALSRDPWFWMQFTEPSPGKRACSDEYAQVDCSQLIDKDIAATPSQWLPTLQPEVALNYLAQGIAAAAAVFLLIAAFRWAWRSFS